MPALNEAMKNGEPYMANGELKQRAILEIQEHGSINALSKSIGVNPGVVYRVMHGGNSPTLRRLWDIPKNPPVPRLIINGCPPALKARYEDTRGEMSRPDFLGHLLDWYDYD
jgi:hypothetical protein